jgi:pantetheine-phosphate adenylyltransferase
MKEELLIGVYAGTFDFPTIGHEWMIKKGAKIFDEFTVSIGINPDKKPMFQLDKRIEMLETMIKPFDNTLVTSYENQYLSTYAKSIGANCILRGIRNGSDYTYEHAMRNVNGDLNPDLDTIFLMPPRELAEVSSSFVKGLIGPLGWQEVVKTYVPEPVYTKIIERFDSDKYARRVA